jgi:hypothetical protein
MSHAPWKPVEYELADASAIQALVQGAADETQQRRALAFIIEQVCGTYDMSYHAGEDGRRDTDFAEGRRFVGNTLVKMTKLNLSNLRRKEE